jgi:uncharacterized repeat protein (TIGR03803 family)
LETRGALAILGAIFMTAAIGTPPAQASTYKVTHKFAGSPGDGACSYAALIRDSAGNLYGTTTSGGASGYGAVFMLDKTGTETVLYSFTDRATDGLTPYAGLVRDSGGNLYGTTYEGGAGVGVVYKLDTAGTETVLHTFTGGADGALPYASVIRDAAGNLYGTTAQGGLWNYGVVFKLDKTGKETVLYNFTGGADGGLPRAGVIPDSTGNLYGTTSGGGAAGWGVVFKLNKKTGTETVLHTFTGRADGGGPMAGVIRDSAGNLYGTTSAGGISGYGVVFMLDKTGTETALYSFTGGTDGATPLAGLIRDSAGNLYGTTNVGGASGYAGVVFKVDTIGTETVLHNFTAGADGAFPYAGLVRDSTGNLYGTTCGGGIASGYAGDGVVFKIKP